MNALVWFALVLLAIWVAGVAFFKIVGFAIHLALVASVILLIAWALRRASGSTGGRTV